MVRAWYMDNIESDQRLEHQLDPPVPVDLKTLFEKSGVLYWKIDAENHENDPLLSEIREKRGYNYKDILECSKYTLPDYDEKLKIFFKEHLHSDEEIRFVLDGSGFFDVRDKEDKWIRIHVEKGDLIVLPAGIYHRFTLDSRDYIKAMRLFCGEPIWLAINRPADEHPSRKTYVEIANKGFEEASFAR